MHPVDWTIPQAIDWPFSALYIGFALLIVTTLPRRGQIERAQGDEAVTH